MKRGEVFLGETLPSPTLRSSLQIGTFWTFLPFVALLLGLTCGQGYVTSLQGYIIPFFTKITSTKIPPSSITFSLPASLTISQSLFIFNPYQTLALFLFFNPLWIQHQEIVDLIVATWNTWVVGTSIYIW